MGKRDFSQFFGEVPSVDSVVFLLAADFRGVYSRVVVIEPKGIRDTLPSICIERKLA